jgi:hypothetical protein
VSIELVHWEPSTYGEESGLQLSNISTAKRALAMPAEERVYDFLRDELRLGLAVFANKSEEPNQLLPRRTFEREASRGSSQTPKPSVSFQRSSV